MKTVHKLMILIFIISIFALSASCNTAYSSAISDTPGQTAPSNAVSQTGVPGTITAIDPLPQSPTPTQQPEPTSGLVAKTEPELPFKAGMNAAKDSFLAGEEIKYGISIADLSSGLITIDPYPPASQIKLVGQDEAIYSTRAGTRTQDIDSKSASSW